MVFHYQHDYALSFPLLTEIEVVQKCLFHQGQALRFYFSSR